MSIALKNLVTPSNLSIGVGEFIGVALHSDITTFGTPTAPFTNPGDSVKITTAHTFDEGKGFAKYALAPDKNQIEGTAQGDKGNMNFTWTVTAFIPGSYAEVHEQMSALLNQKLIIIVPDSDCDSNMYYQFGTKCTGAYAMPDFSTGTTREGAKGYNVRFEVVMPKLFLYVPPAGPVFLV